MKKKLLLIPLALLLAISLIAIGFPGEETTTPPPTKTTTPPPTTTAPPEPISLVINDHNPPGTGPAVSVDYWAEYVEQESGGMLDLEVIHGAALFTGDEIYGQLESSGCDGGVYVVDREDGFLLNLVLTLPFLGWPEQHFEDAFWTLMDEYPEYAAEWEGVTVISVLMMPGTQFNTVDKVIATPADVAGVKMFCAEASLVNIFDAVGGTGVELPITEMAPSVATGVVDGVFNHYPVCNVFGALELMHCHTVFGAGVNNTPMFLLMSTDVLNGLPGDLKDLLLNSGDAWFGKFKEMDDRDMGVSLKLCEDNNDTFVYLTPSEVAEWRGLIKDDVIDTWIADCVAAGLPGQAVFDRVLELISEMS